PLPRDPLAGADAGGGDVLARVPATKPAVRAVAGAAGPGRAAARAGLDPRHGAVDEQPVGAGGARGARALRPAAGARARARGRGAALAALPEQRPDPAGIPLRSRLAAAAAARRRVRRRRAAAMVPGAGAGGRA